MFADDTARVTESTDQVPYLECGFGRAYESRKLRLNAENKSYGSGKEEDCITVMRSW